ncbi:MAG: hypothetical protein NVSMB21_07070 [Vulcanimicrobiaceae bacterium]
MKGRALPNQPIDGANDAARMSWRETLEAMPGLAYALHPDGSVAFVNTAVTRATGLSSEAFVGRAWVNALDPSEISEVERMLERGIASREPFTFRHRLPDARGGYRRYDAVTAPYCDGDGRIVLWLGIATDIEDLVEAIASLADSQERLRTFLETVPQIVWTADPSGWIDWYNARWYEFTGQTIEEAAGWGWQEAHHPQDFAEVMLRWPHSIATGEPFDMEFRLRRHDGEFRWMLTRVVPLRDAAGAVVRWYGSNTEIHDQKLAQQRTSEVARLLQDTLLPSTLPAGDAFSIDALYEPTQDEALVGGDWYDATTLPDGRILLSIGDVTGRGVEAAAYAARLRQSLSFAALEDPDPARTLERVNRLVFSQGLAIATAGVAIFDPVGLSIVYALAGHPPPIIACVDTRAALGAPGGLPLGAERSVGARNHVRALSRHGVFAFYTAGIGERDRNVPAAERALCDAAASIVAFAPRGRPAIVLRDAVRAGARGADDAAIVVLHVRPPSQTCDVASDDLVRRWRFHSSHALSARNARRVLADYLRSNARDPDAVYEAELVIGEILANTVEHAPGLVEIEIDWTKARPRFIARDEGAGWTPASLAWPQDAFAEDGRGTPLVAALAEDVVYRRRSDGGTEIACVLPIERDLTA